MVHCCVPGCHITGGKGRFSKNIRLHRLPKNPHRAKLWLKSIPRDWKRDAIQRQSIAVCSLHFIAGVKSNDSTAPNYIPTIFPSISTTCAETKPRTTRNSNKVETPNACDIDCQDPEPTPSTCSSIVHQSDSETEVTATDHTYPCTNKDPYISNKKQKKKKKAPILTKKLPPPTWAVISKDHDYHLLEETTDKQEAVTKTEMIKVTQELSSENKKLKADNDAMNRRLLTTETIFLPSQCRKWTGLQSYLVFQELLTLIMNTVWKTTKRWCGNSSTGLKGHVQCLSPQHQLLLTLVRLKTNTSIFQLSHMYGVSEGTVCEIFTTWITMLHTVLKMLFHLPPKHKVQQHAAPCYKQWPKLVIILDCTELFIETPSNLQANKEVYSNYKQHDTAKFLVGISPNLCVIFVSEGWGGRASDKTITLSSEDLLEWLHAGDLVMSDKGFLVGQELAARNIKILMPDFKGSDRSQFTSAEIEHSENVSKARVHIERVIGRIKCFEILHGVIKLSMLDTLTQVFRVCSYLVNFQSSTVHY